ncbi:MAG: protein kinase [Deltaproteobacteria bacterium]|nr:protein kinase [Deltaproteobacteria bacterium]
MHEFHQDDVIAERYQILEEIGRGGFGTVYKARHLKLECDLAVKTMQLDHAELTNREAPAAFERFKKEAQALTKLAHTGIVQVIDFGFASESTPYLVMKYAPGLPLLKWGEQTSPTIKQWLTVFRKIFEALEHAHEQNIIHRDLKSSNVLVSGTADKPKVSIIDWGIAYSPGSARLTQAEGVIGTLGYIDPINLNRPSAEFVPQSDFYAVGGLLYEALCKRVPFKFTDDMSPLARRSVLAHNEVERPRLANADVSGLLERFILRLMATERDLRPPTARAAIVIIEKLLADEHFDIDDIYAMHPFVAPSVEVPAVSSAPPGAAPVTGDDANRRLAEQLEAAKAKADSVESKKTVPLNVPNALGKGALDLSAIGSKQKQPEERPASFENNAEKLGLTIAPQERKRLHPLVLPIAAAAVAVVATLIMTDALRSGRSMGPAQAPSFVPHPVSVADLETKKDETTLAKFAPEEPKTNALSGLSPEIKANYPQSLGGDAPPGPVGTLAGHGGSKRKHAVEDDEREEPREKKREEFDRTLRPAGSVASDRDRTPDDPRNNRLAIPHNTEADVRLIDTLDTSNDEPVRAELVRSLSLNGNVVLPIGAILWGKTQLRYQRAQVRFDRVVLPNGEERRINATAVTSDGRDGIEGGRFEFGDPPDNKAQQKVLRAVGTVAAETVSSLIPGTDGLSRSAQQLSQDEIRDAANTKPDNPKSRNRVVVQRKTQFSIRFTTQ